MPCKEAETMTHRNKAEQLAIIWIDLWNKGQPDAIPLAENFVHTSPFGRIVGREHYLEVVKPMAKRNVTTLEVLRTLAGANQAVIHFEMHTPKGVIPVCDWIKIEGDHISEIHSFYDATDLRE